MQLNRSMPCSASRSSTSHWRPLIRRVGSSDARTVSVLHDVRGIARSTQSSRVVIIIWAEDLLWSQHESDDGHEASRACKKLLVAIWRNDHRCPSPSVPAYSPCPDSSACSDRWWSDLFTQGSTFGFARADSQPVASTTSIVARSPKRLSVNVSAYLASCVGIRRPPEFLGNRGSRQSSLQTNLFTFREPLPTIVNG
jgi:hypothetical protein